MIKIFEPYLSNNLHKEVGAVIKSNWLSSQGKNVNKFESKFSKIVGVKYCLATSSCTTSLHLALNSLNLEERDEIICPDLTFIAPANMVIHSKGKLVLVDVDKKNLTIDLKSLKKNITKKTKVIILVHAFGHSCQIDEINKIIKGKKINLIEDVAESLLGKYKNRNLGTFGDFSCFSFFANKTITTGEGGMLATNNYQLYKKAKILRDHGMSLKKRYFFIKPGFNYRMTNIQATIGLSQLKQLEEIYELRRNQMNIYYELLSKNKNILLRNFDSYCTPVHWLMTIHLKNFKLKNKLMKFLYNNKIESRPMIRPVHKSVYLKNKFNSNNFPNSIDISKRSIHLPSSTNLSKKQIQYISTKINNFF